MKVLKKTYFDKNFRKSRFGQNYWKILGLVEMIKKFDLGQNLQISRFYSKFSKNFDFGQNFQK